MSREAKFIGQAEIILKKSIGEIVGRSIFKSSFAKLNKDISALSADDCKAFLQNIQKTCSGFVTKEEAGKIESELNELYKSCFS